MKVVINNKKERLYTVLVLLFAMVGHIFAGIIFNDPVIQEDIIPVQDGTRLFYIALSISFVLTVLSFIIKKQNYRFIILGIRLILNIIICFPMGKTLILESLLFIPLLFQLIIHLTSPWQIIMGILSLVVIITIQYIPPMWGFPPQYPHIEVIFVYTWITIILFLAGFRISRLENRTEEQKNKIRKLTRTVKQITMINMDFQSYAAIVEEKSRITERKKISRELHDIIGYALTNQKVMLDAALVLIDSNIPKLKELLLMAKNEIQTNHKEARRALYELRETFNSETLGLRYVLKLANNFERITETKVNVHLEKDFPESFGQDADFIVYRFVQEGMTNAFRHGQASVVNINFWKTENEFWISIIDNGEGAKTIDEGIGLRGMKERFDKIGGTVEAKNTDNGFGVYATIPVKNTSGQETK